MRSFDSLIIICLRKRLYTIEEQEPRVVYVIKMSVVCLTVVVMGCCFRCRVVIVGGVVVFVDVAVVVIAFVIVIVKVIVFVIVIVVVVVIVVVIVIVIVIAVVVVVLL